MFAIYLVQVMLLAALGGIIGLALGAALPYAVALALRRDPAAADRCRRCIRRRSRWRCVYGLLTALAFALWPLGRAHDVPVGALFRDKVAPLPQLAAAALHRDDRGCDVAALAALAVLLAYDRRVATIYVAPPRRVFVVLRAGRRSADGDCGARCRMRARRPCAWRSPTSTGPAR